VNADITFCYVVNSSINLLTFLIRCVCVCVCVSGGGGVHLTLLCVILGCFSIFLYGTSEYLLSLLL
jgi:hypothetical protein